MLHTLIWALATGLGGGFSLRMAADTRGVLFDGHVLAAPKIHHAPPLARPRVGGWAVPFMPRLVGLTILHTLGLRFWEHLPVIAFAPPLLIGDHDELFNAAHYPAAIGPLNRQIAVRLVPGIAHSDWYVSPQAFEALDQALRQPGA